MYMYMAYSSLSAGMPASKGWFIPVVLGRCSLSLSRSLSNYSCVCELGTKLVLKMNSMHLLDAGTDRQQA